MHKQQQFSEERKRLRWGGQKQTNEMRAKEIHPEVDLFA